MSDPVLFLVGPTGSGKSKLALALAQKMGGEIISCDSMQVYRGMDIGTAKPTRYEQKLVPHHLIDLVSPRVECSVFKHRRLAVEAIQQILQRGRIPIVVGGSGLYVKALLDGLTVEAGAHTEIRQKLETEARRHGLAGLYARLQKMDPKRARRVHPNDKRRIIRALEILRPPLHWQMEKDRQGTAPLRVAATCPCASRKDWYCSGNPGQARGILRCEMGSLSQQGLRPLLFGLARDRAELYRRIEKRVEQMFAEGWIEEVKRLKKRGFSQTARAAIGYPEILLYLRGKGTLPSAKADIKKKTRHLAKKQMTWFRRDKRIRWILVSGDRFVLRACRVVTRALGI